MGTVTAIFIAWPIGIFVFSCILMALGMLRLGEEESNALVCLTVLWPLIIPVIILFSPLILGLLTGYVLRRIYAECHTNHWRMANVANLCEEKGVSDDRNI